MINTKDQEQLFSLISKYIKKDVSCIAIGGTAMMFLNYKNTTKDIDLVFDSKIDLDTFVDAIKELGYSQRSLKEVYTQEKIKSKNKPLMYTRGDERFDLFLKNVFGFELDKNNVNHTQLREDFIEKQELNINIISDELLIILKTVTDREKDFEDIVTIVKLNKNLNWDTVIDLAIKQKKHNSWILHDLEETLQKLKKIIFIPQKYFNKIYANG